MADARQKLVGLLDYVEQVVRVDERVVFRLPDYRLADGSTFALTSADAKPSERKARLTGRGRTRLAGNRKACTDPATNAAERACKVDRPFT
jgi:hypothetical protein